MRLSFLWTLRWHHLQRTRASPKKKSRDSIERKKATNWSRLKFGKNDGSADPPLAYSKLYSNFSKYTAKTKWTKKNRFSNVHLMYNIIQKHKITVPYNFIVLSTKGKTVNNLSYGVLRTRTTKIESAKKEHRCTAKWKKRRNQTEFRYIAPFFLWYRKRIIHFLLVQCFCALFSAVIFLIISHYNMLYL